MPKEQWGVKRVCPTTGKRFYDLNKTPIISPYTGEVVVIDLPGRKGSVSMAAETAKAKVSAAADLDTDDVLLDDDDDVADGLVGGGEREVAAEGLGLQQIERPVEHVGLAPAEVLVGVVDELVRHHAESDEHDAEDVGGGEHGLAPRRGCALGPTLGVRDRDQRHDGGEDEREEERLVHEEQALPSIVEEVVGDPVVCDQHLGCLPRELLHEL